MTVDELFMLLGDGGEGARDHDNRPVFLEGRTPIAVRFEHDAVYIVAKPVMP